MFSLSTSSGLLERFFGGQKRNKVQKNITVDYKASNNLYAQH